MGTKRCSCTLGTSVSWTETSYEKWVKAYECKVVKSWSPYEWFDTPEKLDYPGLPDYPEWYSKQKGGYLLTMDEYARCQREFK